jgi:transcriptional regulator with XRE-family HTH domain
LRRDRGLSLRALAQRCGLSVNAISRIEHGLSSPTVSSLHRCAQALGVHVTTFFEGEQQRATVLVRRNRRPRTQGEGVLIESLGAGLQAQRLGPFLITLLPSASGCEGPISHAGEEFAYCVQGEVEYLVNDEWHRLETGDSLLFRASQAHSFRNTSLEKAVVLVVLQAADEEAGLTPLQHLLQGSGPPAGEGGAGTTMVTSSAEGVTAPINRR